MGTSQTRWTFYDGLNPYADFDSGGTLTKRYMYGREIDSLLARWSPSDTFDWYLGDMQGTVRDIADKNAVIQDHITYDAFGKVLSESSPSTGDRFKYTGREYDSATGLYYYRARYYDPGQGKFIGQDPIKFAGKNANLYAYVQNTSTIMVDPTGHEPDGPSDAERAAGKAMQEQRRKEAELQGERRMFELASWLTIRRIREEAAAKKRPEIYYYIDPSTREKREAYGPCVEYYESMNRWYQAMREAGQINQLKVSAIQYKVDPTKLPDRAKITGIVNYHILIMLGYPDGKGGIKTEFYDAGSTFSGVANMGDSNGGQIEPRKLQEAMKSGGLTYKGGNPITEPKPPFTPFVPYEPSPRPRPTPCF